MQENIKQFVIIESEDKNSFKEVLKYLFDHGYTWSDGSKEIVCKHPIMANTMHLTGNIYGEKIIAYYNFPNGTQDFRVFNIPNDITSLYDYLEIK